MPEEQKTKPNHRKRQLTFGTIFTAAMILCCVGLYYFGAEKDALRAAAQATPEPGPVYRAETEFLQVAAEYGLAGETALSGVPSDASAYCVRREGLADAELVLSKREGGVCAFTLRVPIAEMPEELGAQPSLIEVDLYEQRLAKYELEQAWLKPALEGLCAALDAEGALSYADGSAIYALALETAQSGKSQSGRVGGADFRADALAAGTLAAGEGKTLCVSVQLAQDAQGAENEQR